MDRTHRLASTNSPPAFGRVFAVFYIVIGLAIIAVGIWAVITGREENRLKNAKHAAPEDDTEEQDEPITIFVVLFLVGSINLFIGLLALLN